ncbi:Bug family tripartite tricarboxylate transporter substrate binding protein [Ornithinibacillus halophilus]|uniref:Putative tricarboxylic transport membrane protein n=1 Tax=Ornithinibacillus halophilus TaxID=930117 RepID=A0A1M5HIU4_9BACI|nr:tripartite tricarboxylate transporter substrate binding protein [Ornithinibacillus halophilus]SHG15893.1 putative tricarboxylic transport membrane protein [Ornithinibacillus halophilus]
MLKKNLLLIGFSALLLLVISACSNDAGGSEDSADNYPERDIEVYVGHGPGGGTDTFVRTVTNLMKDSIDGANFNIINQEGGSGVIAMQNAMKEDADGYTLVGDSAYAVTTAAGTNKFGLDKVKPIARIQSDTYALQVKNGTFDSIDELVEYAKENPGEVRIAAVGTMGIDEITARRFIKEAGVDMNYIPAEGAGNMHSDLLGGHIDVILEEVGPTVSYIEEGEFKPLVFFAEERLEDFPDVPTTVEKGWELIDGVERYLMIHADAPQEIVDLLEDAAKKAMETDEYKEYAANSYLDLRDGWMGSEDFTKKLEEDIAKYEEILAEIE